MGHHPFWFWLGNKQIYSCLSDRKHSVTCKRGVGVICCIFVYIEDIVDICASAGEQRAQWIESTGLCRGHFRAGIAFGVSPLLLYKEADPTGNCQSIFSWDARADLSRKINKMKAVTLVIFGKFFPIHIAIMIVYFCARMRYIFSRIKVRNTDLSMFTFVVFLYCKVEVT